MADHNVTERTILVDELCPKSAIHIYRREWYSH